jgi:hypothetical protein
MIRLRRFGLLLIVGLSPAACSSGSNISTVAPVAAQLSVERFLQAANARDFESMGRLFGTPDGSVMETGSTFSCFFQKVGSWFGGSPCTRLVDVELRMDAIASILRHDDYRIAREESVAGRTSPARRVIVDLTIEGSPVSAIPFIVVRTSEGRWLVEQIPLERIMAAAN